MPPIFEILVAGREKWAESQPEPDRSRWLKLCAYRRAEHACADIYTRSDADPKTYSMYLDMMIAAVNWVGIVGRSWRLWELLDLRRAFKESHPKKHLSWRSGFFGVMFAMVKGPLRDGVPFMKPEEMEEIRRLTRTPESEERIEEARIRASTPSEYKPKRWTPQDLQKYAPFLERQRLWNIYHKAAERAFWAMRAGDEKECEQQLDLMIHTLREFKFSPWIRSTDLQEVWQHRRWFTAEHPKKRLGGKSRWFWLLIELLRPPWRTADYNPEAAPSQTDQPVTR